MRISSQICPPMALPHARRCAAQLTQRWSAWNRLSTVMSSPQAVFLERIGLDLERTEAGVDRCALNVVVSPLHRLRQVFDLMPTAAAEEWEAIDARLAGVAAALAGYRVTLREEAERGHVVAARQYAAVAEQIDGWTGVSRGQHVFAALVEECDVTRQLQSRLEQHADEAAAAFGEIAEFLREDMAPRGHAADSVGRDAYLLASRVFLGATIDLEETYAWAWDELIRIDEQILILADQIRPGASKPEAIEHLDADPQRWLPSPQVFRDWMQDLSDQVIDELGEVHFDIPDPLRRLECRLALTHDGGIYYTNPSEDLSRPGRMWWAVPDGMTEFSTWRERTTVFHEGVPGHHLQIGQVMWRRDRFNRWQRMLCEVSGHSEGWALYAEALMADLGYLDDPGDMLGMLDQQAYRAARVIVDIGMHLQLIIPPNPWSFHQGERWTPGHGLQFMLDRSTMPPSIVRFEVLRYLGWPGQAPSYKIGERIWLQARKHAEQRSAPAFDLAAFHRRALNLGPVGLDTLQAQLAWDSEAS